MKVTKYALTSILVNHPLTNFDLKSTFGHMKEAHACVILHPLSHQSPHCLKLNHVSYWKHNVILINLHFNWLLLDALTPNNVAIAQTW